MRRTLARLSDLGVRYSVAFADVPARPGSDDVERIPLAPRPLGQPRVPRVREASSEPGACLVLGLALGVPWLVGVWSILWAAARLIAGGL